MSLDVQPPDQTPMPLVPAVSKRSGNSHERAHASLWQRVRPSVFIAGVVAICLLGTVVGLPIVMVALPIAVLIAWGLLTLPLDVLLPVVVFLALAVNNPVVSPHENRYAFVLDPLGKLLYKNLPLKLSPLHLVFGILLVRTIATIKLSDVHIGGADRRPPRPFAQATVLSAAMILAWTVYGIGTGGDVKNMLWQVRPLLMLPVIALVSSVAMARERCLRATKLAIIAASLIKVVDGSSYYFLVVRPHGLKAEYVSTHSDSVLWAVCIAVLLADWFEARSAAARNRLLIVGIPVSFGMLINNRRTVWVIVAAGAFFIVLQAHRPVKSQIARILSITWPALLLYIFAGVASPPSIVFKPVQMIKSVIVQKDASSSTRDIENYNLLQTIRARPLIGYGFGHPYLEVVRAYDVTGSGFTNYRYLPHNSFLGLWAFGGLICAAGYLLLLPVSLYYAVWARKRSRKPGRRAAGDWAACAIIAYLIQGWSDIGLEDWTTIILCGVALGVGAALSQHVRAESEDEPRVA
jgi:O-Antigen ligase